MTFAARKREQKENRVARRLFRIHNPHLCSKTANGGEIFHLSFLCAL